MPSSPGDLLIANWVVVNAHDVPLHEAGVRVVDGRVTDVGPAASLLAAFPGSRRRVAVDPVSAPIAVDGPPPNDDDVAGVVATPIDVADDRTGAPV